MRIRLDLPVRMAVLVRWGWIALLPWGHPRAQPVELNAEAGRLRTARELQRDSRFAEALEALGDGGASQVVPDHVAAIRGDLLLAQGDTTGAWAAYEQALTLGPTEGLRVYVLRQLARLEVERGAIGSAYESVRVAWEKNPDAKEAAAEAFRFAAELERRNLRSEALRLYRTVWERWPGSMQSASALTRFRALREQLEEPLPDPASLILAGEALRALSRCGQALEFFGAVLEREDVDATRRIRALRGRADCAFQQRRYADAIALYRELAAEGTEALEASVMAARAVARGGDAEGGARELEAVEKRASARERPRIQHLLSVLVRDKSPEEEQRLLRQVAGQDLDVELAREASWRLAWLELQARNFESALAWLEPLAQGARSRLDVQRARYWAAVARSALDATRGEKELRAIADELPLTYYGMLAAQRVGMQVSFERSFLAPRSGSVQTPAAQRAVLLIEAGWIDHGRYELRSWLQSGSLTREDRVTAAGLLHRTEDHSAAAQLVIDGFGLALDEGIDPVWREAWQAAWPEPFAPLVRSAAREFDCESAFVYAIMREESLYRPDAESAAGARGLLQLIPPTAQRIAQKLAVNEFTPEALYDPGTNVRFGAYYLTELLREFDGSLVRAAAAYNAGPEAVRRWMERTGSVSDDEFVDAIPYNETRRYVRRVLRSYRVYKLLYASRTQVSQAQPANERRSALISSGPR